MEQLPIRPLLLLLIWVSYTATFGEYVANSFDTGLISDINRLTNPIAKLIAGQPPEDVRADVTGVIQELPQFFSKVFTPQNASAVSANIDFTKIPPAMIQYVMRGGKLPGIPDDLMQQLIQKYLAQLSSQFPQVVGNETNTTEFGDHPGSVPFGLQSSSPAQQVMNLPPLQSLPKELVQQVLNGGTLPGFSPDQMNAIKAHYIAEYTRTLTAGNTAPKLDLDPAAKSGFTISESSPVASRDREHPLSSSIPKLNGAGGNYNLNAIATERKEVPVSAQLAWGLGALIGCAGIITVIVIVAIQRRRRRCQNRANDEESTVQHKSLHDTGHENTIQQKVADSPKFVSPYGPVFPPEDRVWDTRVDGWSAGWVYQPRVRPVSDRMI